MVPFPMLRIIGGSSQKNRHTTNVCTGMAILLDLDGTLTDPKEGILNSLRFGLERLGRPIPPDEDLLSCIGPPLRDGFGRLLETDDPEILDRAVAHYREWFADTGIFENAVYDGIADALESLRSEGQALFLATSKPLVFAERILDHFDLRRFFSGTYGSGLDGSLSDKTELIAHIIKQERLGSDTTTMVGDRKHDAIGAIANGVRPVGALWGYGSRPELEAAGCTLLCPSPFELPTMLSS